MKLNPGTLSRKIWYYNENKFFEFFKYWPKRFKKNLNCNMDILISNMLSELIFDLGKWSNWVWPLPEVEN